MEPLKQSTQDAEKETETLAGSSKPGKALETQAAEPRREKQRTVQEKEMKSLSHQNSVLVPHFRGNYILSIIMGAADTKII